MISPNTLPGSEVVCIDASPGQFGPVELTLGEIYTVRKIEVGTHGFVALLNEVKPREAWHPAHGKCSIGFGLCRFRPLELPRCITELLDKLERIEDERIRERA